MEVSEGNLRTLADYLRHTLSPDVAVRKPAERFLESVEVNKSYPVLLLHLVAKEDEDLTLRVAGAVAFKNYVKRNWKVDEDSGDKIHAEDRELIKQHLVGLMLKSPESVQRQLSDAITVVGREDFPNKWPGLLQEMVEKFASGNFHVINGVLRTAHSIFKRYRHEFKSQELWTEIRFVVDGFTKPLTDLFVATIELSKQHEKNQDALRVIYSSLILIAKIFYSLNFQDLPDLFEDLMEVWMKNFLDLLSVDNKLLESTEEDNAGLLEQLKSQICDNVGLYAQKYDEEFRAYSPPFVKAVWVLLIMTGNQPKYDLLVSNALQFLALVAERQHYRELFEDATVLSSICEKVVIPNMEFRQSDEELFEMNPEEFIHRDMEGADVGTRRRAACELIRSLSFFFEAQITSIFGQYVQILFRQYSENPSQQWRSKDVAIYLVTTLAAKAQTAKHGTTKTNQLVDLVDFYRQHVLTDLHSAKVNEFPVLKAAAVKYVIVFRSQLPPEMVVDALPHLVTLLGTESIVVHSYAANAIDKILLLKAQDGSALVKGSQLSPLAERLLNNLFATLTLPGSEENEYVMKAIMRSFSALQEHVVPYLPHLLPKITEKLVAVAKNPSRPHFNHYLFETLSLSIRIVCRSNPVAVGSFEQALFPVFQDLLRQDVQEFVPYVFQILSLLLEVHEVGGGDPVSKLGKGIPEPYMALFPCLLIPVLWERPANLHPLVRLLQCYVCTGPQQVLATQGLNGLLGIFQKLISSKLNDHEGFYLMQSLIEYLPRESLSPYLRQVLVLLFQRLSSSKTTKFVRSLIVFLSIFAIKYGATQLVELVESIQAKMFGMVLDRLVIADVQKVSGQLDRKICAVGITRMLSDCPAILTGEYAHFWPPLLQALIGLFELPEDESLPADEHFVEIEDTPGYQTAYSQLIFAGRKERDPLGGSVSDPRLYLASSLHTLSGQNPGKVGQLVGTLGPEVQACMHRYLQSANLTLV